MSLRKESDADLMFFCSHLRNEYKLVREGLLPNVSITLSLYIMFFIDRGFFSNLTIQTIFVTFK